MARASVEGHDQGHGRLSIPRLGDVEREAAPRLPLVVGVKHAHLDAVVAERAHAQARHQVVIPPQRGIEEPSAHRIEGRGEGLQRLLHPGEAAHRPIEIRGSADVRAASTKPFTMSSVR